LWFPIPPLCCDDKRALGQHNEAHIISRAAQGLTKGWQNHPEVKRWREHLPALAAYHDMIVEDMRRRGWPSGHDHKTPMIHEGPIVWPSTWEPIGLMRAKLADKIESALVRL
jgi:hypothetical protein